MTKRTLDLKREQLADLTTNELNDVAGAGAAWDESYIATCTPDCVDGLTRRLTCYCTLVC